jgi:hypothetical protein
MPQSIRPTVSDEESLEGFPSRVAQRPVHDQLSLEAACPQLRFPRCPIHLTCLHRRPRVSAGLAG